MNTAFHKPHIVGIGGTLREHSTSHAALERALAAAEAAGATTELLALNDLHLPLLIPRWSLNDYDESVARYIAAVRRADGLIWSAAAYQGTIAGVHKNALDLLELLSEDVRPYLHGRVVGLIATAGGEMAAVNTINAMVHAAHALRASVVPLMVPISAASRRFDRELRLVDDSVAQRLEQLGRLVVETAATGQRNAAMLGAD